MSLLDLMVVLQRVHEDVSNVTSVTVQHVVTTLRQILRAVTTRCTALAKAELNAKEKHRLEQLRAPARGCAACCRSDSIYSTRSGMAIQLTDG